MLLKNCTIIDSETGEEETKDILIKDGKIIDISDNIDDNRNFFDRLIFDINNKHVLPGLIDPSTHLREPGMEYKEDFLTGSMAAVAGGYTSIIDMPDTNPRTKTAKLLEDKKKLAKKSIVNYGFHLGTDEDSIEEIKKSKKIAYFASTNINLSQYNDEPTIEDDKIIEKIFKASDIITVHAKDNMVEKALQLSKKFKKKIYLCHISKREEIDTIRDFKEENPKDAGNIFVEASANNLFLSIEDDKDGFTKTEPPLGEIMDSEELWIGIKESIVNAIGTDHSPHTVGEKMIDEPLPGIPSLETTLPLLLNAVNDGRITLFDVQNLCSKNIAEIFGIKNKGKIEKGYDADLTIVDMEYVKTIDEDKMFTKCKWTPFDGFELQGFPILTIVGGNIVFSEFADEDKRVNISKKGTELAFR